MDRTARTQILIDPTDTGLMIRVADTECVIPELLVAVTVIMIDGVVSKAFSGETVISVRNF